MKKCPFCAEDIQDAAIVCKHCGRNLQGQTSGFATVVQQRKKKFGFFSIISLAVLFLFLSCAYLLKLVEENRQNDQSAPTVQQKGLDRPEPWKDAGSKIERDHKLDPRLLQSLREAYGSSQKPSAPKKSINWDRVIKAATAAQEGIERRATYNESVKLLYAYGRELDKVFEQIRRHGGANKEDWDVFLQNMELFDKHTERLLNWKNTGVRPF